MAASALKKDDTQTFLGLLIGRAKAEYQNEAAREELQNYLNQFGKLEIASETLVKETPVSDTKKYREFDVVVKSKRGEHVADIGVKCQLNYGTYEDPFQGLLRTRANESSLRCRPGRDCEGDDGPPPRDEPRPNPNWPSDDNDRPSIPDRPSRPEPRPEPRPNPNPVPSWPDDNDRPNHPDPRPTPRPTPPDRPDRPDWPDHPNRPDWPYDCRDYRPGWDPYRPECDDHHTPTPQPPSTPVYNWFQSCRIQTITK